MAGIGGAAAALCAVLLVCGSAQAQSRPAISAQDAERAAQVSPARRAMRVDRSGRWSVDFSLDPSTQNAERVGDVGAGAYYRVSPRLRVGASAGLTESPTDPVRSARGERDAAPRVRLESTFRF